MPESVSEWIQYIFMLLWIPIFTFTAVVGWIWNFSLLALIFDKYVTKADITEGRKLKYEDHRSRFLRSLLVLIAYTVFIAFLIILNAE